MPQTLPTPLPKPLRGNEADTFTHYTHVVRMPDILRRTVAEGNFPPGIEARLNALIDALPFEAVEYLDDPGAPDEALWNTHIEAHLGQAWLDTPWLFSEPYFYRRVIQACGYFQLGPGYHVDPFSYQKTRGLRADRPAIHAMSRRVREWMQLADPVEALSHLLAADLWGNQADLSMWPAQEGDTENESAEQRAAEHILADDRPAVIAYLLSLKDQAARVDIALDNVGIEMITDLFLANFLLEKGLAGRVSLHAKLHPTYVSDAIIPDIQNTIAALADDEHADTQALGEQLQAQLDSGRLTLSDHVYWTSPVPLWSAPDDLLETLSQSALLVTKGDANYRRIIGDRHWPYTTPFAEVLRYVPTAVMAVRVAKSEVMIGMPPGRPEELFERDPEWLYDGQWGVIQFCELTQGAD
jgi:hypothetical protein